VYADKGPALSAEPGEPRLVRGRKSGVLAAKFIPADAPLFRVVGDAVDLDEDRLRDGLIMKLEPTLDEDVSYGIRLLVDIAERSLADSPFQDPTTAVQAIDRLHDILRQLARRPFPDGRYRDAENTVRLTVRTPDWDAYVLLATEEIRQAGAGSPQISRRLASALTDLRSVAPPERRAVLDRQLERLRAGAEAALDAGDVAFGVAADPRGIGVAAGARPDAEAVD
jgi:uncharacterized membrane protein